MCMRHFHHAHGDFSFIRDLPLNTPKACFNMPCKKEVELTHNRYYSTSISFPPLQSYYPIHYLVASM